MAALGRNQREALRWMADEDGTVAGPAGDRVLRSLVRRGMVERGAPATNPTPHQLAAYGRVSTRGIRNWRYWHLTAKGREAVR